MSKTMKQLFRKREIFENPNSHDPNMRYLEIEIFDVGGHPHLEKIHARYVVSYGSTLGTIGKKKEYNSLWISESDICKDYTKYLGRTP